MQPETSLPSGRSRLPGETWEERPARHAGATAREPLTSAALIMWGLILLIVCFRAFVGRQPVGVYPIFAEAGRNWLRGADLYQPGMNPFRYSPLVAMLLVPLGVLPDWLAGVLWRLLNFTVFLGAFAWWARTMLPRPVTRSQHALLFLLMVPLSVGSLNNGQSNPLVLGFLLVALAAVPAKRWTLCSSCLALACLIKVYPIAIALLLLALYPRKLAGRFAVVVLLGLLLPFLAQRPGFVWSEYERWIEVLRHDDRSTLPAILAYRNFGLLCRACGFPLSTGSFQVIQLLAAGACGIICLAGQRAVWPQRRLLLVLLACGCIWMTLFGSATESCTYILLAPTLAWALIEAWLEPPGWWHRFCLLASFGLFLATQIAGWFPDARRFHALGPHPLAACFLLLALVLIEWRRLRRPKPSSAKAVASARAA